jgi:hypothetical protein
VRGIRRPLPLSPVARCRLLCAVNCGTKRRPEAANIGTTEPLRTHARATAAAKAANDERHVCVRFTSIIGSPCGVPLSSTISDLWFLSCASCGGFAAAEFVVDWLAAPASLRSAAAVTEAVVALSIRPSGRHPMRYHVAAGWRTPASFPTFFDQLAAGLAPRFSVSSERS